MTRFCQVRRTHSWIVRKDNHLVRTQMVVPRGLKSSCRPSTSIITLGAGFGDDHEQQGDKA